MGICMGAPYCADATVAALEYYAKCAETSPRTRQGCTYRSPDKNVLGIMGLILSSR
jgi:hypothetical protein